MVNFVLKRDGRKVKFEKDKIIKAISKAGFVADEVKEKIATEIGNLNRKVISIEDIQDLVEKKLMATSYKDVAKEYVRYRFKREIIRNSEQTNNSVLEIVSLKNQDINEENSNKNPVILSTQRDYMAGEVSKDLSVRLLLPDEVVKAHNEGIIHFHDMDYFAQKMHNCFSGKTMLVTNKGVAKFSSFRDGEVVEVLDKNGEWRQATIRKYGKQQMQTVTLKVGKTLIDVECTPNHRWLLKDGTVTTNLQLGDKLYPLAKGEDFIPKTLRDKEMFCFGFVLGDGSDRDNGFQVRLCGDKVKYLEMFREVGYRISKVSNSNDYLCSKITPLRKQDFLNSKLWNYLSFSDKVAIFNGYYSADGAKDRDSIFTTDLRLIDFIKDVSSLAKFHVLNIKKEVRDTPYKENVTIYKVKFTTHQNYNKLWEVVNIKKSRRGIHLQNAWCVEEPITKSFTLANGIVTGNCCLINLEDMLQNGTVINGTMIEKPHSFATACNIATQIMAQVASNQYGFQN